jgi:hypothetical protein
VRQKLVKDALVYLDQLSHQTDDASLERELVQACAKSATFRGIVAIPIWAMPTAPYPTTPVPSRSLS